MHWSSFGALLLPVLVVPFVVAIADGGLAIRARHSRSGLQRLPDVELRVRRHGRTGRSRVRTVTLTAEQVTLQRGDPDPLVKGTARLRITYRVDQPGEPGRALPAVLFALELPGGRVVPARRPRGRASGRLILDFRVPEDFTDGTVLIGGNAVSRSSGATVTVETPVRAELSASAPPVIEDFEVIVPIYGSIDYLENVEYLRQYGDRVLLCTTTSERPDFDRALDDIARTNGFRVFRGVVPRARGQAGRRATTGTIRDRLVRDALELVERPYVVCVDADTTTPRPLSELIGAMVEQDLDLASVRLVPIDQPSLLTRLQVHEYRIAMQMLRVVPWLVSGACHAARTEVHRSVMRRHSLFFQGNDVELGALADAAGYRIGHVPFQVDTAVPGTVRSWLRQRIAWSGGVFRLFIVNVRMGRDHPVFWFYGAVVVTLLSPLRFLAFAHPGRALLASLMAYLALVLYLHWDRLDRSVAAVPLYHFVTAMVIVPLGALVYAKMALGDRNAGIIRPDRGAVRRAPQERSPVRLVGFRPGDD